MLTYTFSKREKVLVLVFAIILVFVAWFWFVFQGTNNQMIDLESRIATTDTAIDVANTRIEKMNQMADAVAQRKAEGAKPVAMPVYDNLQPLMAQLNRTMASAKTFTLTFDDINRENEDYILRGVRIDYTTDTYKQAERIVESIYGGLYPCSIDSVMINDPTVLPKSGTTSGVGWTSTSGDVVSASVHVTYFEKYPEGQGPVKSDASAGA